MARIPSTDSIHFKFYIHIVNGGRVWRDDKLNKIQEWMDLESLGGDASKITLYGYQDLTIPDQS